MPGTAPPRNVIYVNGFSVAVQQPDGSTGFFPYPYISSFSYTDVILGFLIPDPSGNGNLIGDGSVLPSDPNDPLVPYLKAAITGFQNAGQNALVSVGGACGWVPNPTNCPNSSINFNAWQNYSSNVGQLVSQIVSFVQQYQFNGVDIDFEDDNGFTGGYNGIQFLSALTSQLAQQLPPGSIITHAPQTPYWDTNYYQAPYAQIWQQVGNQITWINNQFYDNYGYDQDAPTKIQWYKSIAGIMGGTQKLLMGAILDPNSEGFLVPVAMRDSVLVPLTVTYGSSFGGVMAWEWSLDTNWVWTNMLAPPANEAARRTRPESWNVNHLPTADIIRKKFGCHVRARVRHSPPLKTIDKSLRAA